MALKPRRPPNEILGSQAMVTSDLRSKAFHGELADPNSNLPIVFEGNLLGKADTGIWISTHSFGFLLVSL